MKRKDNKNNYVHVVSPDFKYQNYCESLFFIHQTQFEFILLMKFYGIGCAEKVTSCNYVKTYS